MAAPVTKASWTGRSAATLGHEVAEAVRIATRRAGRGPVHLQPPRGPARGLDRRRPGSLPPTRTAFMPMVQPLGRSLRREGAVCAALRDSSFRPSSWPARRCATRRGLAPVLATSRRGPQGVPAIGMESPRGLNDPAPRRLQRGAPAGGPRGSAREAARLHDPIR